MVLLNLSDKLSLKDEVLTYYIEDLSNKRNKAEISNYVTKDFKGKFSSSRIRNI